jgi:hypothetical protein
MAEALACRASNGALIPTDRFTARAAELFVDGAVYWVSVEPERTEKSHKHEFAWLKEAWKQLPERLAPEYPTTEHLRKRALIDGGFYDEQVIDVGTEAGALRVMQSIRSFPGEGFSMVFIRGRFVIVRRAKSQSKAAMGAADFQRSKTVILEIVSDLIGVAPEALKRAA